MEAAGKHEWKANETSSARLRVSAKDDGVNAALFRGVIQLRDR